MQTSLTQCIKCICENLFVVTNLLTALCFQMAAKAVQKMKYQKSCYCDQVQSFMWGSLHKRLCFFAGCCISKDQRQQHCLSKLFSLDTGFCKELRDRSKTKLRFLSQCLISMCLSRQRPIRIPRLVTFFTWSEGVNLQVGDCESRTFYMFIEQSPENFRLC